jgi:hypothetical protein
MQGRNITVRIVAGGASAPYALAVHENPSAHDPPTWKGKTITFGPPGRGPKFLEKPLRKIKGDLAQRLANRLKF